MVRDVNQVELRVGDLVERVDAGGGLEAFRVGQQRRIRVAGVDLDADLLAFEGLGGGHLLGHRVRKVQEAGRRVDVVIADDVVPAPAVGGNWVQATADNVVVGSRVRRKERPDIPRHDYRGNLDLFPYGGVATVCLPRDGIQRGRGEFCFVDIELPHDKLSIWLECLDVVIAAAQPAPAPAPLEWVVGAKVRRTRNTYGGNVKRWPIGAEGTLTRHVGNDIWYVKVFDAIDQAERHNGVFHKGEMELIGAAVVDDVIRADDKVMRIDGRSPCFDCDAIYTVREVGVDSYLRLADKYGDFRWISPSGFRKITSGVPKAPLEPPKPVVDMDKIVEVTKARVDTHNCNGAATYGYINDKYSFCPDGNHACHAGLNKSYGNKAFGKDKVAVLNWLYSGSGEFTMDDMRILFNYVTDPEQSPWRAMLDGAIAVEGKGRFVLAITDLSWSGPHIANLCKAFRIFTEAGRAPSAKLFLKLVKEGVHPGVALFMCQHWTIALSPCQGAHGLFFDVSSASSLDAFVHSRIPDKGKSWVTHPAYAGVDSLWPTKGNSYQMYIEEQYKNIITPRKKVTGAFAKNVTVGGLTLDTLIKIAKLESDRLGLSDQ